jgi:hypothetical protein
MHAYYVQWHLIEVWRPLLFADRDPAAKAKRSKAAIEKADTHLTSDVKPVHSLRSLIAELATLKRNTCRTPGALEYPATFHILTTPTVLQRRAFDLLNKISV